MLSLCGLFTAARWKPEKRHRTEQTDPERDFTPTTNFRRKEITRETFKEQGVNMSQCCCSPKLRSSKSKNKKKSKDTSRLKADDGASTSDMSNFDSDLSMMTTTKNGFTDKEKMDLNQAFDLFDKNQDGKISSEELASVIKVLRFNISDSEIEEMIRIVDKNENGFVDYDEYLSLMRRFSKNTQSRDVDEKTLEAFRVFDLDGNGFIDRHELQCVMKTLGENLSEEDIKEMFTEADLNGDGKIDFKEFSRLLMHLS